MTIKPGYRELKVYQGATFIEVVKWSADGEPVNLTGYYARMQAREDFDSPTPFIDLTTGNGGIVLDEDTGTITLKMAATATAAIDIDGCKGFYNLELVGPTPEGEDEAPVYRILEGPIYVSKEVTR